MLIFKSKCTEVECDYSLYIGLCSFFKSRKLSQNFDISSVESVNASHPSHARILKLATDDD